VRGIYLSQIVFDNLITQEEHEISLKDLCAEIAYKSKDIARVKQMFRDLRGFEVEWDILNKDKENEWGVAGLLAEAKIVNGRCIYSFSPNLRRNLHNPKMYARISLMIQNLFTSKHSLALYELAVDYYDVKRKCGETPWIKIAKFRQLMGLDETEYKYFKNLSQSVIKKGVKEVNSKPHIAFGLRREDMSEKSPRSNFT